MAKKNKNADRELISVTPEQLELFDGRGGRPLYLAFKGKVYDVTTSRLWVAGRHMGVHTHNENLTETIKGAPHGEEILAQFPIIGEIRETPLKAPMPPKAPSEIIQPPAGLERRDFLKLVAAAGGVIALGALASSVKSLTFIPPVTVQLAWPRVKVGNVSTLQPLTPVNFNYPLDTTPNILVKLGVKADNGVGPNGDIVAFSAICQHLGCFYGFIPTNLSPPCNSSYKAPGPEGYCCCHGSIYDFVHGAKVLGGPAPRPVPQVQLQYDQPTGDIYALSMGPPTIYGHGPPGTTDPASVLKYDLQGGQVVSP